MARIKYVGPFDSVDVPGLGTVEHGSEVSCSAKQAESLLAQTDNWQPVKGAPKTTEA